MSPLPEPAGQDYWTTVILRAVEKHFILCQTQKKSIFPGMGPVFLKSDNQRAPKAVAVYLSLNFQ